MLVVTANWAIGDGTLWRRPLRGLVSRAWGVIQRSHFVLASGAMVDTNHERLDIVFAGEHLIFTPALGHW